MVEVGEGVGREGMGSGKWEVWKKRKSEATSDADIRQIRIWDA